MRSCQDCKFCINEDYGYSNYTVEGTISDCLLHLNENYPVDRWYGHRPEHDAAEECERFSEGECVNVDVDREDGALVNYSEYDAVKELMEDW